MVAIGDAEPDLYAAIDRAAGPRQLHPPPLPDNMAALGSAGGVGGGIKRLCMTHHPLEERIAALKGQLPDGTRP